MSSTSSAATAEPLAVPMSRTRGQLRLQQLPKPSEQKQQGVIKPVRKSRSHQHRKQKQLQEKAQHQSDSLQQAQQLQPEQTASLEKEAPRKRQPPGQPPITGSPAAAAEPGCPGHQQPQEDAPVPVPGSLPADALSGQYEEQEQEGEQGLDPDTDMVDDGLTEYERQRNAIIRRNLQRMEELQLPGLAASLAPPPRAKPSHTRGLPATKKPRLTPPLRQSARVRGMAANPDLAAGVYHEGLAGDVQLAAGTAAAAAARLEIAKERHPQGPLPFKSENAEPKHDAAILDTLRTLHSTTSTSADASAGSVGLPSSRLPKLRLKVEGVAKVTRDGVTSMSFHPSCSQGLVLAAGDKQGNVALWSMDRQQQHSTGEDFDGLLHMKLHHEYVSSVQWLGGPASHLLATSSYDGSIRLLDVNTGTWEQVPGLPDDIEISAMESTLDGRVIYTGDNQGAMLRLDCRESTPTKNHINAHDRRINTIHLEPLHGHALSTSGSDARVKVWDVRKLGSGAAKPVHTFSHLKSCHAAFFAPDGSQRLLSTSYDDTLRVWGTAGSSATSAGKQQQQQQAGSVPAKMDQLLVVKHNNQTGRWITPFRAIWGPGCDWLAVGNMKKGVDIFSATSGVQLSTLQSEHLTAIPSRLCVHAHLPALAAATSSGRVHVWRT